MPSGKANAGGTTVAPPRPQPRRDDPRMAQGVSLRRIPKNGTASLWGCAHRRLVLHTLKLANGSLMRRWKRRSSAVALNVAFSLAEHA